MLSLLFTFRTIYDGFVAQLLLECRNGQNTQGDHEVQKVPSGGNGEAIPTSQRSSRGMFVQLKKKNLA